MRKQILVFLIIIFWESLTFAQPGSEMPNEPGKCYAKGMVPDQYGMGDLLLPVYIGPPVDTLVMTNISAREFVTQETSTKWEKKMDKNCLSPNPDNCLVWCLVEVPKIKRLEYFVKDTSLTKEFFLKKIKTQVVIKKGGYTEWVEVICEKDNTKRVIEKLQETLRDLGFYTGDVNGKQDSNLTSALVAYQQSKGMVAGSYTVESLKALKVIR